MTQNGIKVGVIGYPAQHSLSPLIHNAWMKEFGFPGLYNAIDIPPDRLEESVVQMAEEGYAGFNVTIPHKQAVLKICDSIDETARRIGAVNTVSVLPNGRLKGFNTDSFGFVENILQAQTGIDFTAGPAVVLGAGGAARAVVHGLMNLGVPEVTLTNRTRDRAEEIAAVFPAKVVDWEARENAASGAKLLVNTTSLGMAGQPPLEYDLQHLPENAAVCDIVYKPLMTDLLRNAEARSHKIVTGIGMLLHQARPAFREWFGIMPEVSEELQQKILEASQ